MEHKAVYCEHCERETVICGACGNNCCNGDSGENPDGAKCAHCEGAHQQDQAMAAEL
jgi:hypothetical protein